MAIKVEEDAMIIELNPVSRYSRGASRRLALLAASAAVLALPLAAFQTPAVAAAEAPDASLNAAAVDAYVYGYPLVTMELTRRNFTNVVKNDGKNAPMGVFVNIPKYPAADDHRVTAPNADTLYSTAWIDVGKEPYILHVPDEHGRYYLMPMLSGWTDVFADPGKRTTGTAAADFAIVGPGWKGTLPAGIKTVYNSPTSIVWVLGRTYSDGTPADYAEVNAIQAQYSLTPLSAWGKPYTPPDGAVNPAWTSTASVRDQVGAMDGATYFTLLAQLMKANPPAAVDAPMVATLARIGLVPGQDFDPAKLSPAQAAAIAAAAKPATASIMGMLAEVKPVNGWFIPAGAGVYGTNYRLRALVTAIGLGANRPQDAIYPIAQVDGDGKPFDAANPYVVHFAAGQLPPVNGFWSITMYDPDYFFVPNPLNRYTVSARNDLKKNPDGSVDLYLQANSPGADKESNWLPTPASGKFIPMMRLYWPKETPPSILDGSWQPPAIQKAAP
jgi:hypothetical protein